MKIKHLIILLERKFGDIERLTTASLTNGVTEKAFGSASNYNSPLGASYPIVKSQPSQPSQSQKSHHIGKGDSICLVLLLGVEISIYWGSNPCAGTIFNLSL